MTRSDNLRHRNSFGRQSNRQSIRRARSASSWTAAKQSGNHPSLADWERPQVVAQALRGHRHAASGKEAWTKGRPEPGSRRAGARVYRRPDRRSFKNVVCGLHSLHDRSGPVTVATRQNIPRRRAGPRARVAFGLRFAAVRAWRRSVPTIPRNSGQVYRPVGQAAEAVETGWVVNVCVRPSLGRTNLLNVPSGRQRPGSRCRAACYRAFPPAASAVSEPARCLFTNSTNWRFVNGFPR